MGCIISIIGALVALTCSPPRSTPAQAAALLAAAPGLSNRTNVYTPTVKDVRPRILTARIPASPVSNSENRSAETGRAIRMGTARRLDTTRMGTPPRGRPLTWAVSIGTRAVRHGG
jgi:hypothetical protein